MKIDTFYRKLKPTVKDIISYTLVDKCPKTFKKYADFCIDIDNRMHKHEVECHHEAKPLNSAKSSNSSCNTHNSSSTAHIPPAFPSSSSTVLPAGKPMEIDMMKTGKPHGPLTPVVFEGPVQSGLWASRGLDQDRDQSSLVQRPQKTTLN